MGFRNMQEKLENSVSPLAARFHLILSDWLYYHDDGKLDYHMSNALHNIEIQDERISSRNMPITKNWILIKKWLKTRASSCTWIPGTQNSNFLVDGCLELYTIVSKGQLISKANFLVLIWTKNQTKLFFDFCPSL